MHCGIPKWAGQVHIDLAVDCVDGVGDETTVADTDPYRPSFQGGVFTSPAATTGGGFGQRGMFPAFLGAMRAGTVTPNIKEELGPAMAPDHQGKRYAPRPFGPLRMLNPFIPTQQINYG